MYVIVHHRFTDPPTALARGVKLIKNKDVPAGTRGSSSTRTGTGPRPSASGSPNRWPTFKAMSTTRSATPARTCVGRSTATRPSPTSPLACSPRPQSAARRRRSRAHRSNRDHHAQLRRSRRGAPAQRAPTAVVMALDGTGRSGDSFGVRQSSLASASAWASRAAQRRHPTCVTPPHAQPMRRLTSDDCASSNRMRMLGPP